MEVHFTPEQEEQLTRIAVNTGSVVAEMRALQARIKPDPDGWTARDYVLDGRR
jgi:hypothetical protein